MNFKLVASNHHISISKLLKSISLNLYKELLEIQGIFLWWWKPVKCPFLVHRVFGMKLSAGKLSASHSALSCTSVRQLSCKPVIRFIYIGLKNIDCYMQKVGNIEQSLPPSANSSPSFGFPLEDKVDVNIEWYIHTSLESTQQRISCSFAHLLGNCLKEKKNWVISRGVQ